MNITKDEASILAIALDKAKYDICDKFTSSKEEALATINSLNHLQAKLEVNSKDYRRIGRKSKDDFHDMMRRFIKTSTKKL